MNEQDKVEEVITKIKDHIIKTLGESPEAWRGFTESIRLQLTIHDDLKSDILADHLVGAIFCALVSDPFASKLIEQALKSKDKP